MMIYTQYGGVIFRLSFTKATAAKVTTPATALEERRSSQKGKGAQLAQSCSLGTNIITLTYVQGQEHPVLRQHIWSQIVTD